MLQLHGGYGLSLGVPSHYDCLGWGDWTVVVLFIGVLAALWDRSDVSDRQPCGIDADSQDLLKSCRRNETNFVPR